MRGRIGDAFDTLFDVAFVLIFVTAIGFLVAYILLIVDCDPELYSTWPESSEFSQLMTGQERFSEHATNVDGLVVVVDHETGVQYLTDGHGMTALLDADGTPLRVREASDDGE